MEASAEELGVEELPAINCCSESRFDKPALESSRAAARRVTSRLVVGAVLAIRQISLWPRPNPIGFEGQRF